MSKQLVKFYYGSEENYLQKWAQGGLKGGVFFSIDENGENRGIWFNGARYSVIETNPQIPDNIKDRYDIAYCEIIENEDKFTPGKGYTIQFIDIAGNASDPIHIHEANENLSGLMSSADYSKLASIDAENIVYKEAGKGLSTNDFTDELKEHLESIEPYAQVNTLEEIKIDDVKVTPVNKVVNIPISEMIKEQIGDKVSTAYVYKGSVAAEEDLPTEGLRVGDVYNIESESSYGDAGVNVAWNGSEWDSLGGVFDFGPINNKINVLEGDVKSIKEQLETLEDVGADVRIKALEDAVKILNSDETIEGSVSYTSAEIATKLINDALSWEEI